VRAPQHSRGGLDRTVAVFAPTVADGEFARKVLGEARIEAAIFFSYAEMVEAVAAGVGTAVLLYECLATRENLRLEEALAEEPPWSAVPLIVLMRKGTHLTVADSKLASLRRAAVLERPVTIAGLVSAIRAALEARQRQYEIRDLLSAAQRASEERARLHSQAVEARAAAESANRMKDEFLATVSHELRTPLNAILGWATLLNRDSLDKARTAQAIETIERNAKVQAKLIEDLLDVSRIISGTLRLDVQTVELIHVIEEALATIAPAAEARQLRITRVFDPKAGPISGDPGRLQQVIWNLLSNAVKFTPRDGRIQVVLERVESHVQIRVSDSGCGIPAEFLPSIFERFRQFDSSTTRAHGGMGLGLAIVRQLVELHGGTVTANSEGAGKGTTFVVRLPLVVLHRQQEAGSSPGDSSRQHGASPPVSLSGLRILAVDDEADSLALLSTALTRAGAEVITANSALEGIEQFRKGRIDLAICDIGMPRQDGYAFIRKIRELEAGEARWTPAIALTAYARPEDRLRTVAAGFQAHVAKPADPLELIALVASLARTALRSDPQ
jgi:signal transduction histidine kinase/CheY-like chemotaxis protein